jgi:hypothetical protein
MKQHDLKNEHNCFNTNIYSYSKISGVQSSNLYLNVLPFSMPVLIRHLWQLKTDVFLHWSLIRASLLVARDTTTVPNFYSFSSLFIFCFILNFNWASSIPPKHWSFIFLDLTPIFCRIVDSLCLMFQPNRGQCYKQLQSSSANHSAFCYARYPSVKYFYPVI